MKNQWCTYFHLWNRDNSNTILVLHIWRKLKPWFSSVKYRDFHINVRKSPPRFSYMKYRKDHISCKKLSIQIFIKWNTKSSMFHDVNSALTFSYVKYRELRFYLSQISPWDPHVEYTELHILVSNIGAQILILKIYTIPDCTWVN